MGVIKQNNHQRAVILFTVKWDHSAATVTSTTDWTYLWFLFDLDVNIYWFFFFRFQTQEFVIISIAEKATAVQDLYTEKGFPLFPRVPYLFLLFFFSLFLWLRLASGKSSAQTAAYAALQLVLAKRARFRLPGATGGESWLFLLWKWQALF